jgi:polygalacturonase
MVKEKTDKFKEHIQKYKVVYTVGITGVGVAGITWLIMRGITSQPISSCVTGTTGSYVIGTGKKVIIDNVSFISADRQGPPSWVVRYKETGMIFTSQRSAAIAMEISEFNLSKHLNGFQEDAQGYHFERICMAA